jgi:hypothetical protein
MVAGSSFERIFGIQMVTF